MMAAAASRRDGFSFVVLDRPNPIGGTVRGPVMHAGYTSFVGRAVGFPATHGMTVGELARLFAGEYTPTVARGNTTNVTVVPMAGWRREDRFGGGLPWILPSPNMPTVETATV